MLDGEAGTLCYLKDKPAETMFREIDADNSGFLDKAEITQLCTEMGKKLNKKELQSMMEEMDSDGSGEVSFPEFEAWWQMHNGKQADKRETAAGVIEIKEIKSAKCVGGIEIQLTLRSRTYQLQGRSSEDVARWLELLRQCIPSSIAERRELASRQALRKALAGDPGADLVAELTLQHQDPGGIVWMPLRVKNQEYALVQDVQMQSSAAMAGVRPNMLLGFVQGMSTVGYTLAQVMSTVQSERPLQLGFSATVDQQVLKQFEQADPALPFRVGEAVVQWLGDSQQAKGQQPCFLVVDIRGVHSFKLAAEASTDGQGQYDITRASSTVPLAAIEFQKILKGSKAFRITTAPRVTMTVEFEKASALEPWVLSICDAVYKATGQRPDAAAQLSIDIDMMGEAAPALPPAPLPWGVPTGYVCKVRCQAREEYGKADSKPVAFCNVGDTIRVRRPSLSEDTHTVRTPDVCGVQYVAYSEGCFTMNEGAGARGNRRRPERGVVRLRAFRAQERGPGLAAGGGGGGALPGADHRRGGGGGAGHQRGAG